MRTDREITFPCRARWFGVPVSFCGVIAALLFVCAGGVACGGDDDEIQVGDDPVKVSEDFVGAYCERGCQELTVECMSTGEEQTECMGVLSDYPAASCAADIGDNLIGFVACALEKDRGGEMQTCLNDYLKRGCPTQADAAAAAVAAENGTGGPNSFLPSSCAGLFVLECEGPVTEPSGDSGNDASDGDASAGDASE